jgi:Universal stress protein family
VNYSEGGKDGSPRLSFHYVACDRSVFCSTGSWALETLMTPLECGSILVAQRRRDDNRKRIANMTVAEETARVSLKNILYLTDFSKSSEAALPFAIAIARNYGANVHALHAKGNYCRRGIGQH